MDSKGKDDVTLQQVCRPKPTDTDTDTDTDSDALSWRCAKNDVCFRVFLFYQKPSVLFFTKNR